MLGAICDVNLQEAPTASDGLWGLSVLGVWCGLEGAGALGGDLFSTSTKLRFSCKQKHLFTE